jgi:4-amino-4-deoxy-L-arabinose transferase-like glycosyltransferase
MIFFSQIYLISIDGAFQYIPVAKLFAWGEYKEALHQLHLPLYLFLVSVVSKITGNFEVSGQIISLVASILAVIPLFLLGKYIFGETAAFWAGIFYLLNPEMLQRSVDVLKEGLLILLLFWAVFFFYLFLNRRRIPKEQGDLATDSRVSNKALGFRALRHLDRTGQGQRGVGRIARGVNGLGWHEHYRIETSSSRIGNLTPDPEFPLFHFSAFVRPLPHGEIQ